MQSLMPRIGSHAGRLVAAATLGASLLGGAIIQSPPAHGDDWCYMDPIVSINGQQTHIVVGIQGSAASVLAQNLEADIIVTVPEGVSTAVIVPPATTPFLETLHFVHLGSYNGGSIPVTVVTAFSPRAGTLAAGKPAPTLQAPSAALQVLPPSAPAITVYGKLDGLPLQVSFSQ